jgi:hypothetical protein
MKLKYALEDDRARDYALEEQFQKENPKYPLQLDPTWKYYRPNTASLTAHNFHADMKLIREIMNGPQQIDIYCALDDVVLHRSWINFPDYLKNPVEDLKQLRPTFTAKGTLWALQDYSVHGLFPSGYPCMKGSAIYNIESALNPVTISPKTVNP